MKGTALIRMAKRPDSGDFRPAAPIDTRVPDRSACAPNSIPLSASPSSAESIVRWRQRRQFIGAGAVEKTDQSIDQRFPQAAVGLAVCRGVGVDERASDVWGVFMCGWMEESVWSNGSVQERGACRLPPDRPTDRLG